MEAEAPGRHRPPLFPERYVGSVGDVGVKLRVICPPMNPHYVPVLRPHMSIPFHTTSTVRLCVVDPYRLDRSPEGNRIATQQHSRSLSLSLSFSFYLSLSLSLFLFLSLSLSLSLPLFSSLFLSLSLNIFLLWQSSHSISMNLLLCGMFEGPRS